MIEEQELRSEIEKALKGAVSLEALYSWLMARSWNMHKDSDAPAEALANHVEDLFFERSDGFIGEQELRRELASLVAA